MNPLVVKIPARIMLVTITDAAVRASISAAISRMNPSANRMPLVRSEIASANLKLGDLELTASRFSVGGPKPLSAQIDSNNFNLANLAQTLPSAAGYGLAGMSEIHGHATLDNSGPIFDATVTLKQVGLKLASLQNGITDLNGTIRFTQGREVIEPTTFSIGSAHGNLEGRVDSVNPLNASYVLKADSIKLSELFPSRPGNDLINQLVVNGTAD